MAVFRRKRKTVGLDIGSAFAKLVEVDHGGDTPELTRVAVTPVPPGAMTDGEVTGPGRLRALVQKLGETLPAGTAEVVTALGGHDVFIKILSMPSPSGAPKGEAVRREAEHHIPFDLREIRLDHHVLGTDPDDGSAYYHHWVAALEGLVADRDLIDLVALSERKDAWAEAYRRTPHGQPVELPEKS